MKKIYQIPTAIITNIELQQMIATSDQVNVGNDYDGTSPIESRRRNSIWDDEEDEDY